MAPRMTPRARYDAVVVGGRIAGAATAMLLARAGMSVLVVERSPYGSDTLSTHALMRAGVLQLARWGLLDAVRATGAPPIRTTTFHYGDATVPIPITARDGVDALYAPRRHVIDALLADAARAAGVEMRFGVRVTGLDRDAVGRVTGVVMEDGHGMATSVEADIVIGADGYRSTVARLVAAPVRHFGRHMTGLVYGYYENLDLEGYHWYFRPGVSAGVIPTNGGAASVFASMPALRFREEIQSNLPRGFDRVLSEVSEDLAGRVRNGVAADRLRGFPGHSAFLRQSWGPGWALVGDAGYYKDTLTAHGMTDALRDAELLARAITAGGNDALAAYQETRDELSTRLLDVTDEIAAFQWSLETIGDLHHALSREMKREVVHLRALGENVTALS